MVHGLACYLPVIFVLNSVCGKPTSPASRILAYTDKTSAKRQGAFMKIILWAILIIFIIGLLVVTGVFKMIF